MFRFTIRDVLWHSDSALNGTPAPFAMAYLVWPPSIAFSAATRSRRASSILAYSRLDRCRRFVPYAPRIGLRLSRSHEKRPERLNHALAVHLRLWPAGERAINARPGAGESWPGEKSDRQQMTLHRSHAAPPSSLCQCRSERSESPLHLRREWIASLSHRQRQRAFRCRLRRNSPVSRRAHSVCCVGLRTCFHCRKTESQRMQRSCRQWQTQSFDTSISSRISSRILRFRTAEQCWCTLHPQVIPSHSFPRFSLPRPLTLAGLFRTRVQCRACVTNFATCDGCRASARYSWLWQRCLFAMTLGAARVAGDLSPRR